MRVPELVPAFLGLLVLSVTSAHAQELSQAVPAVVSHAEPIYPSLARQAKISGDVHLKVSIDRASVTAVEVEGGHPLLQKAAEDNVRTWKFESQTPATFHVTFRYKLIEQHGGVATEFLESSGTVLLVSCPPQVIADDADVSLGNWSAQIMSSHGKLQLTLQLYYTGENSDWLNGRATLPSGSREEIDYGHRDGNFLIFSMMIKESDGQRVKTVLTGKMAGNQIVGSFIDDRGIRGEWTAVKLVKTKPPAQ